MGRTLGTLDPQGLSSAAWFPHHGAFSPCCAQQQGMSLCDSASNTVKSDPPLLFTQCMLTLNLIPETPNSCPHRVCPLPEEMCNKESDRNQNTNCHEK